MLKLLKVTTVVSVATITGIIVGIIRSKFTAVTLGPAGVGIFSQAFNFQQLMITVSSLSIGLGIGKYVSEYSAQNDYSRVKGTILAAFIMQGAATLILLILVTVFLNPLSNFLFSSYEYSILLFILALSIFLFVIVHTLENVLFGFGNYQAFVKCRSFLSLFSLLPLFLFIPFFKIKGGFVYLIATGFIAFGVYGYIFHKSVPAYIKKHIFSLRENMPSKDTMKKLAKDLIFYAGAMSINSMMCLGTIVFLRSLLIKYFGAEANGYYQVVFVLSAYYIALFTNGLWFHSYLKLNATKDADAYSAEINSTIRFCILGIIPIAVLLFLSKDIIINLIFSHKFVFARELFSTQLAGDIFFLLFYVMNISLLASSRLKAYLLFGLFSSASFIAIFLLTHNFLGIRSITVSYFLSNLMSFSGALIYHVGRMRFKIYSKNIKLFLSAIVLCAVVFLLGTGNIIFGAIKVALLLAWAAFLPTASEKKKAYDIISGRIRTALGRA